MSNLQADAATFYSATGWHKSPDSTIKMKRMDSPRSSKSRPVPRRAARSMPSQQYTYFTFPSLVDASPEPQAPPPPPTTVHYWTSEETRRLEYAAIDAASRGIRGFLVRLVPDCILPDGYKRTKFHNDDSDSDAGSVRRYRLAMPEEKAVTKKRLRLFRRWTTK